MQEFDMSNPSAFFVNARKTLDQLEKEYTTTGIVDSAKLNELKYNANIMASQFDCNLAPVEYTAFLYHEKPFTITGVVHPIYYGYESDGEESKPITATSKRKAPKFMQVGFVVAVGDSNTLEQVQEFYKDASKHIERDSALRLRVITSRVDHQFGTQDFYEISGVSIGYDSESARVVVTGKLDRVRLWPQVRVDTKHVLGNTSYQFSMDKHEQFNPMHLEVDTPSMAYGLGEAFYEFQSYNSVQAESAVECEVVATSCFNIFDPRGAYAVKYSAQVKNFSVNQHTSYDSLKGDFTNVVPLNVMPQSWVVFGVTLDFIPIERHGVAQKYERWYYNIAEAKRVLVVDESNRHFQANEVMNRYYRDWYNADFVDPKKFTTTNRLQISIRG